MTPTENGVSSCCGASVYENMDVCCDCKEHCDIIDELAWLDDSWKPTSVTYNGKEL